VCVCVCVCTCDRDAEGAAGAAHRVLRSGEREHGPTLTAEVGITTKTRHLCEDSRRRVTAAGLTHGTGHTLTSSAGELVHVDSCVIVVL